MRPLIVYGAGGLGREIALAVMASGSWQLRGFVDDDAMGSVLGVPILGGADSLAKLSHTVENLAVIVAIGSSHALGSVPRKLDALGARVEYPNFSHAQATINWSYVEAGRGNVVCAGARVNNAVIGSHNIINMNVVLGHDCVLGDRNLISPSATLNGQVSVGSDVTIGAGATVLPRVSIGDGATIAIGAVVGASVAGGDTVVGNPARVVARKAPEPT